jgi:hypothetical protein
MEINLIKYFDKRQQTSEIIDLFSSNNSAKLNNRYLGLYDRTYNRLTSVSNPSIQFKIKKTWIDNSTKQLTLWAVLPNKEVYFTDLIPVENLTDVFLVNCYLPDGSFLTAILHLKETTAYIHKSKSKGN